MQIKQGRSECETKPEGSWAQARKVLQGHTEKLFLYRTSHRKPSKAFGQGRVGLVLRCVSQNLLHIWAGTRFNEVGLKKAHCLDALVFIPDIAEALNLGSIQRSHCVLRITLPSASYKEGAQD